MWTDPPGTQTSQPRGPPSPEAHTSGYPRIKLLPRPGTCSVAVVTAGTHFPSLSGAHSCVRANPPYHGSQQHAARVAQLEHPAKTWGSGSQDSCTSSWWTGASSTPEGCWSQSGDLTAMTAWLMAPREQRAAGSWPRGAEKPPGWVIPRRPGRSGHQPRPDSPSAANTRF